MKKRLVALLLVLLLVAPCALASAVTYYRVNTSWLKIREIPSDSGNVLDSYRQDYALTVNKKVDKNWSLITFTNGVQGYALSKYFTKCKSYRAWITSDDTALRRGPGYGFDKVGTLARGAKITVLTHGKTYDYVSTTIGNGYVHNGYISKKKVKASGNASTPTVSSVNYTAWTCNASKINLRTGASMSSTIIDSYPSGTQVDVYEHGPEWDYVGVNGNFGFMKNHYLSKEPPIVTPADPDPAPFTPYTAYITSKDGKSVNVRKGAGTGYSKKCSANYGAQITVLEPQSKGWYKIQIGSVTGYVQADFVQLNKPADAPENVDVPQPQPEPTPFAPYYATITCPAGEKVNVRRGEGYGYGHKARLDPGTTVYVIELGKKYPKSWVKVQVDVDGKTVTGYVPTKFLQ